MEVTATQTSAKYGNPVGFFVQTNVNEDRFVWHTQVPVFECELCGGLLSVPNQHDRWHQELRAATLGFGTLK